MNVRDLRQFETTAPPDAYHIGLRDAEFVSFPVKRVGLDPACCEEDEG